MADLDLSVLVSRTALGLDPLEINDYENFYISGEQLMGGSLTWNRTKVTGPWDDGDVTTQRQLQTVQEPVGVEVLGGDIDELMANEQELTDAFFQGSFTITVTIKGTVYAQYQCEADDLLAAWSGPRLIENQVLRVFTVPRQPVPLAGVY